MKYSAVIVDDESAARNVLQNLLILSHSEIEVVAACPNLPEAVLSIRAKKPDIVFLDVEMPQFAGYEIVNFFDEIDFQIVFVTAYDKYALKAFELNAVDYLLKPIQRSRLAETVDRLKQRVDEERTLIDYKSVVSQLKSEKSPVITFAESGKKHLVKTVDIMAISAQGAYCDIYLKNGDKLVVSKNIGSMETELAVDTALCRTHKSWIINVREVVSVQKTKETILLHGGILAKLSRFKKDVFQKALESVHSGIKI